MKRNSRLIPIPIVGTLALLFAGCDCATTITENDPTLMKNAGAFQKAFNERDPDAGGSLYTEDAIFMIPNTDPVVGREAIAATFANPAFAGMKLELSHQEAVTSGDLGYVYGTYTLDDPEGTEIDNGKYMEIHRKVDGEWLMDRDIYNSNLPIAAASDEETTRSLIREFVSVWNSKSYEKLAAIIAPDGKRINPDGSATNPGPAGFEESIRALHAGYPDLKVELTSEDYYPGGAVLHWRTTGTNTGPGAQPPTNKPIDLQGLTKVTVENGKIVEELLGFDTLTWMQQLGQAPAAP